DGPSASLAIIREARDRRGPDVPAHRAEYDRKYERAGTDATRTAALQPSSPASRGRRGRPAAAEGGARALRGRRRTWIAGAAVSRGGGRRHDWARRFRRGRLQQSATADRARYGVRRAIEGRVRPHEGRSAESGRPHRDVRRAVLGRQREGAR